MNPFNREADRADVLNILFQSDVKLTAQAYIKEITARFPVTPGKAKKMLQVLIEEQELTYQYLYGATYVEQSFLKPVRGDKSFYSNAPGIPAAIQPRSDGSGHRPGTCVWLRPTSDDATLPQGVGVLF